MMGAGIMDKRLKIQISSILVLILVTGNFQLVYSQDDAVAWFNRGAKASGTQEKITCYLQAIKLNPKFIEAYYNLGYVYKNSGDYNNAEKAFQQALLSDPTKLHNDDKLRITYELGITLKKLTRYNEAVATLESAKNLASQNEIRAAVLFELGRTKLLTGNFDGALTEFNEGLLLDTSKRGAFEAAAQNARMLRNVESDYVQGTNYLKSGQYDDAIDALTRVVKTSPNYKDSLQKLAEAQRSKDRQTKIDNLSDVYARGFGYMQREDWGNAIIAFKQIEQVEPNYKDVKAKLADSRVKLDQSLQQEIYEKIYTDGLSDYRKGNWVNAIVAFEKVRAWNPNYKNVDRMYRDAQNRVNQEGESTAKNRYYIQGKAYLNSGNWEAAITSFKQLTTMDKNYRDVQFLLQQAQAGLENEAKVKQLDNYYAEGVDHYNNGDWLKAILAFEKIQQIDPNYKDVSEKLLSTQNNLNDPEIVDLSENISINATNSKQENGNWVFIGAALSVLLVPLGVVFFFVPTTRAKWLLRQGKCQKAALIYESILMKKPNKTKLYPSLANIYLLLNRNDDTARKVYEIALQMNINPQLRQRLDEITNKQYLTQSESNDVASLEEKLRKELSNLKSI